MVSVISLLSFFPIFSFFSIQSNELLSEGGHVGFTGKTSTSPATRIFCLDL